MTFQGLVENVETTPARSFATADAAISDTVVHVADAQEFLTGSGTCTIDIEGVAYTATPTVDDTGEDDYLTVDPPLSVAVPELTPVTVTPPAETKWAYVSVGDEEQDLLKCRVPLSLKGYTALVDGPRDGDERETVTVTLDPEPMIVDPPNRVTLFDGGVIDPGSTVPPRALTDGFAPSGSPTPVLEQFSVGALRWSVPALVDNADPVRLRVYADTVDPPTIDAAHLVADTASLYGTFSQVDGTSLLPPDPTDPVTPYYVAVVEYDADGEGPTSATSNSAQAKHADLQEISAFWAYLGQIQANQIESGSVLTQLLNIGSYIEINGEDSSITIYADTAHTQPLVQLRPDGSVFRGRVEANDISVLVGLILQGTDSHIAQSAGITLDASVKDPTVPPVLSSVLPSQQWDTPPAGYVIRGMCWDGTQWLRLIWKDSSATAKVEKINPANGHVTGTTTLGSTSGYVNVNSIVALGTNWYICRRGGGSEAGYFWEVVKFTNTGTRVASAQPDSDWDNNGGSFRPAVGTDGTSLLAMPGSDQIAVMNTSLVVTANWTAATLVGGTNASFVGRGNFDFGADRIVTQTNGTVQVFTLSGTVLTEVTSKAFAAIGGDEQWGFGWDGTNFWSARSSVTGLVYKYSGYYPAASEKAYVTYADTDTPSKKHTKDSAQSSLALIARRFLAVSLPPAPSGAATPRVYMGLATSAPADTALLLRAETITSRALTIVPDAAGGNALVRTATITNRALTSNVATLTTSAPHGLEPGDSITVASVPTDTFFNGTFTIVATPTTTTLTYALVHANVASTSSTGTITNADSNTFGSGTAAWLKSQTGGLELYGDGSMKAPGVLVYKTRWIAGGAQSLGTSGSTATVTYSTQDGTTPANAGFSESGGTVTVADAGEYEVEGFIEFASNASGYRRLSIDLNGSLYTGVSVQAAPTSITRLDLNKTISIGAGGTIRLSATQTSGGALTIAAAHLTIRRVGTLAP
jgi:hypothetical protein